MTPFSRRGSYFAVSDVGGWHLRTVRGGVRHREILRFVAPGPGADLRPSVPALLRPEVLTLGGRVSVALQGAGRALIEVAAGPLTIDIRVRDQYDVVVAESASAWRFVDAGANRNYRIRLVHGSALFDSAWDGVRNTRAALRVRGPALLVVDEYASAVPDGPVEEFAQVVESAARDFASWLRVHGEGSPEAAYVTWSAMVPAGGVLRRESMLMSKNGMTNVWSWDHCFNAMALWRVPDAAADQILTVFDHQDAYGCLPDYVNDAGIERNFVKPPVHGWAVGWLMDRGGLTDDALAELYEPLSRWTRWWFAHRVYGGDGVPSYNHGNDSGWDDATIFAEGVPVQSPDLLAFLALQMQTLARIADRLGGARHFASSDGAGPVISAHETRSAVSTDEARPVASTDEARSAASDGGPGGASGSDSTRPDLDWPGIASRWRERAAETVRAMSAHFWDGDRFVARHTLTHRPIVSDSLITLMPLVLGELLPTDQFDRTVRRLLDGGYLTRYGVATEPPGSPEYVADGYWRGPIWAPTTMLLVDGLRRGGRPDLAGEIARRFVATCANAGMAENFDATTGEGLRDLSMTWTASVHLILVADPALAADRENAVTA